MSHLNSLLSSYHLNLKWWGHNTDLEKRYKNYRFYLPVFSLGWGVVDDDLATKVQTDAVSQGDLLRMPSSPWTSVTRCYIFFSKFDHLEQWKFAKNYKIFAKVGSQFCPILNSSSRNGPKVSETLPKLRNYAKSGHTALDLIRLRLSNWYQDCHRNKI